VPQNKDLKKLVRERMQQTGERYTEALAHFTPGHRLEPLSSAWFMAGDHPDSYEFGLLATHDGPEGARVVRLRYKGGDDAGFGTMIQSFGARKHLAHRVRLHARVRCADVTGWAGLWMRVDDARNHMTALDNMRGRALSGTTGWTHADVVLDVGADADSIHFGVLLCGRGAIDVADLGFEEVDDTVGATSIGQLAEEPRDLDFEPRSHDTIVS